MKNKLIQQEYKPKTKLNIREFCCFFKTTLLYHISNRTERLRRASFYSLRIISRSQWCDVLGQGKKKKYIDVFINIIIKGLLFKSMKGPVFRSLEHNTLLWQLRRLARCHLHWTTDSGVNGESNVPSFKLLSSLTHTHTTHSL